MCPCLSQERKRTEAKDVNPQSSSIEDLENLISSIKKGEDLSEYDYKETETGDIVISYPLGEHLFTISFGRKKKSKVLISYTGKDGSVDLKMPSMAVDLYNEKLTFTEYGIKQYMPLCEGMTPKKLTINEKLYNLALYRNGKKDYLGTFVS